jgi:hypothetical protein
MLFAKMLGLKMLCFIIRSCGLKILPDLNGYTYSMGSNQHLPKFVSIQLEHELNG